MPTTVKYIKTNNEVRIIITDGIDTESTANSNNHITSGDVLTTLNSKQNTSTSDIILTDNNHVNIKNHTDTVIVNEVTRNNSNNNEEVTRNNSNNSKDVETILDGLCHNNHYREKDITDDFLSGKVSANIADETFHDIFPGDRITLNGRTYVVGGLDCYMGRGDIPVSSHHLLMFPLEPLGTAQMNSDNITTGGFKGSEMYSRLHSKESGSYYETISGDFGLEHLLEFRSLLSNDTITVRSRNRVQKIAKSSAWEWSSEYLTLMSETQVFGSIIYSSSIYDIGEGTEQIPVFKLNSRIMYNRSFAWWLRGVASARYFCVVNYGGFADHSDAGNSFGTRPFFLIR